MLGRPAVGLLVVVELPLPDTKGQHNFHIRHLRKVSKSSTRVLNRALQAAYGSTAPAPGPAIEPACVCGLAAWG